MITIQPQYLSLAKLLDGRLFRIPEYQRAYSWTTHQRTDLFEDIEKLHKKEATEGHFMAAVVCLRRKTQVLGTDEFHVVEVVDGQQRLTTLIMLLQSIRLALDGKNKTEERLTRELGELLVKVEAEELLLLQTNHDASQHFATFLRKGIAEPASKARILADRELLKGIEECTAFVQRWQVRGESLALLATLLKNRLHFLLHEIDDERAVYTVFEVLNSRGLDVSWLDRLKSILMGTAFELKDTNQAGLIHDLHTSWRDIYSVVGLRQGLSTEALRFAATLKTKDAPSRPLGEEDAVDVLKALATDGKRIRDVADWLLQVTRACDTVLANPRIHAVTRISQARLLAVALHLDRKLSDTERGQLLRRWEKVSFRIYGLLTKDARTRVGEYVRLAWRIVNEKLSAAKIDAALVDIGREFTIDEAIDGMRETNCYDGWEHELRYFLFRYEEYLAAKQKLNFSNEQWEKIWLVSPSDSIEHVWARTKAPEKHKHRLGNLVVLPPKLNSTLQNIPAKDKIKAYRKTGLLVAGEVAEMIEERGWSAATIADREEALLEWAAKEWGD